MTDGPREERIFVTLSPEQRAFQRDNPFPHPVETRMLHRPGACTACDNFPDRQLGRVLAKIAYTGDVAESGWLPCPSAQNPGAVERDLFS